jgi:hypothetical protein
LIESSTATADTSEAGEMHSMLVSLIHRPSTSISPNLQISESESMKSKPLINTDVPPETEPINGERDVGIDGITKWNCTPLVLKSTSFADTSTATNDEDNDEGETQVSSVEETKVEGRALPSSPNMHQSEVALAKPDPVTDTIVPPAMLPRLGAIELTVGESTKVKSTLAAKSMPLFDTDRSTTAALLDDGVSQTTAVTLT